MEQLLKEKFGDCKFQHIKECSGSYVRTVETEFFIYDPPHEWNEPVKIVNADEEYQLTVTNVEGKNICLVKTDKCLFTDSVSKCDCLLFSENQFYCVEIKSGGSGKIGDRKRKAKEQLGKTIEHLRDNDFDLSKFAVTAVICIKNYTRSIIQASEQSAKVKFQDTYGVSLEVKDRIEF